MWPLEPTNKQSVGIIFYAHKLVCTWIEKIKSKSILRASKEFISPGISSDRGLLHNPSGIGIYIHQFLEEHNLAHAQIHMALAACMFEKIVSLPKKQAHSTDFSFPELKNLIWQYHYITQDAETDDHLFYISGMHPSVLFQYQLLSIKESLNCLTITTEPLALLYLLNAQQKKMMKRDMPLINQLQDAITDHDQLIAGIEHMKLDNKKAIITGLGLYTLGKQYE